MAEVTRFSFRLICGLVAIASVWIIFSRFVIPALIGSAYRGDSLPFLNSIISGQATHPVEHYLAAWRPISWRVLGMLILVGLIPFPLVATGPEVQLYLEQTYGSARLTKPAAMNTLLALLGFVVVVYLYYLHPVGYVYLISEDYWAEYGSFVAWGMASCFLTWMVFKNREARRPGFVLLALGTFFVAMEEISWGQRIVGLTSPMFFAQYSLQGEVSLHNFVPIVPIQYVIAGLVTFVWSILLALLTRKWERFRKWCDSFGIPSVHIHLWPLFLLAVVFLLSVPYCFASRCDELAELFLGIAIAILSLDLVVAIRRGARPRPAPSIAATVSMILILGITTGFLVQFYGSSRHLGGILNGFAATIFPIVGMNRQAEMLFDYMNKHPEFLGPATHVSHGVLLLQMGKHAKASVMLELALAEQVRLQQEQPDNASAYLIAGQALKLLGRQEEAQAEFLRALEKDRARLARLSGTDLEASVRWSLGKTLLAAGESGAALEQLLMARTVAPDRNTLGMIDRWIERHFGKDAWK